MGAVEMGNEVSALDLGVVPPGRSRSMFLAVGCWNDTVQLLSLDPSDVLNKGPSFSVESRPTSLCLVEMLRDTSAAVDTSAKNAISTPIESVLTALYLNVGLEKGVLMRVAVDPLTGDFSDARQRFLGPRAIKLCRVTIQTRASCMALSSKAWLLYNYQNRYHQDPISYEGLEHAADFSSEACPDGIVAVAGNTLRIMTVDNLGALFNQTVFPLRYTPRKMCRMGTADLVIIESDHNEFNEEEKARMVATQAAKEEEGNAGEKEEKMAMEGEEEEEGLTVIPVRGPVPAAQGKWASCLRVVELSRSGVFKNKVLLELQNNEAAFSVCTCRFAQHSEETFVVIGTAKGLTLHPKKWTSCSIHVYRLLDTSLTLLHQTEVDDIPLAMTAFQGRLLVGVGRSLRLYELGKKQLLKKCENKLFPTAILRLQTTGDRIYVGDLAESVLFVKYRRHENVFSIFADDTCPRYSPRTCEYFSFFFS